MARPTLLLAAAAVLWAAAAAGKELVFEMPEHSTQCFYEDITRDMVVTVEHEVIIGGRRDVDVTARLGDRVLFREQRSTESRNKITHEEGTLEVCFSNEFSTMSHKTVYLELVTGLRDDPLAAAAAPGTRKTFTQVETSVARAHDALKHIVNFQVRGRGMVVGGGDDIGAAHPGHGPRRRTTA